MSATTWVGYPCEVCDRHRRTSVHYVLPTQDNTVQFVCAWCGNFLELRVTDQEMEWIGWGRLAAAVNVSRWDDEVEDSCPQDAEVSS